MKIRSLIHFTPLFCAAALLTACSGAALPDGAVESQAAPTLEGEAIAPTLAATAAPENFPTGVLVDIGNDTSLALFDPYGRQIATLETPGFLQASPETVILAGSPISGDSSVSVIYHLPGSEGGLMLSAAGESQMLRKDDAILALAGTRSQAAFAFSEFQLVDGIPHSKLFAGSTENAGALDAFLQTSDALTQSVLTPVGVNVVGESPIGVWYTHSAWGIGGQDLIFPITRGLYYFDLAAGRNRTYLDESRSFQGISPDLQWAGSVSFEPQADRSMTVSPLLDGNEVNFPLKPESDRGAGYAVFSPDDRHIAWLEAGGSLTSDPPDFQATVRVGSLSDGTIEAEVDSAAAAQALNVEGIAFLKPAGWLDDHSLLLEARSLDWKQAYLLRFDLQSGELALFSQGSFLGFSYP